MKAVLILDGKIINTIVVGEGYTPPAGTTLLPFDRAMAEGIPFAERELSSRKIWPSAAELWNEFTRAEKLAIADSNNPDIRLLHEDLRVRRGEVWSDADEVQRGLGLLVAVGILTESRKTQILTK